MLKAELTQLVSKGWVRKPCLVMEQPGGDLYTVVFSGRELVGLSKVLSRAKHERGVQRILVKSRARRIAKFYTEDDVILPNNVIGTISSEHFVHADGYVYLSPEMVNEVIDGQTRLWGFDDEYNEDQIDFQILLTFIPNADDKKKAKIFYKINKEQKKINPSLAFDLLEIMDDKSLDAKISMLAKKLNSDSDSPFKGLIRVKENQEGLVGLSHIVNKLSKFLKTTVGEKFFVSALLDEDALYITVRNYFNAIKNTFPDEWGEPGYVLSKTLGIGAFMELLPDVLTEYASKHGFTIPTSDDIEDLIEPLQGFDFLDSAVSSFGGQKGQKQLADIFRDVIGFGKFASSG